MTGLLNTPLPPYLIGGVQLLQVSESWVSSAKRGIRGAGGAAGVGVGTVGDQFLHKGRIERRICVLGFIFLLFQRQW